MISIPAGSRIYLACGHTDMRNYAERGIMLSPRRSNPVSVIISVG